jgi:hypothetical protein
MSFQPRFSYSHSMAKNLGVIEATRAVGFFTHEDYETKEAD